MELFADKEILTTASKCVHDHICQKPGGKPRCGIAEVVNNAVFFTEHARPIGCPYQHAFGRAHMCTCPARIELYRARRV